MSLTVEQQDGPQPEPEVNAAEMPAGDESVATAVADEPAATTEIIDTAVVEALLEDPTAEVASTGAEEAIEAVEAVEALEAIEAIEAAEAVVQLVVDDAPAHAPPPPPPPLPH